MTRVLSTARAMRERYLAAAPTVTDDPPSRAHSYWPPTRTVHFGEKAGSWKARLLPKAGKLSSLNSL
ncbi:hypothetical protein D3C85_1039050 [compost metagenome]